MMLSTGLDVDVPLSYILTGTWINLLLYAFELLIGFYYLVCVRGWKSKMLLGTVLSIDTAGTALVCYIAWARLLTPSYSQKSSEAPVVAIFILTTLSVIIEQSYFAYRLWTINQNKVLISLVALLILANVVAVSTSIGLALSWDSGSVGLSTPRLNLLTTILNASTNFIIATALVCTLNRIDFLRFSNSTQSLIRKVMVYAVACGCITALVAILMTVLGAVSLRGFVLFFDCSGRIYTLTILFNFVLFHNWQCASKTTSQDHPWKTEFDLRPGKNEPRIPLSTYSQSTVTAMPSSPQGTIVETPKRPTPGPPFSMESIFGNSEEELGL
ncbi:hypothetical protein GYMLUDRAFT_697473 [Collybiopsis luxurians FD-317 M1]|uniref:DUF6534 domain-containing protein n=1 Tax=Collybiopsis luxurians FD-317 M1 TaxID=944289 RepID=A0A0D0CRD5_9AGAR|nr:hypothetical protein GYMLUDRAFT_697473 [Collybiopsis luxurians FD-317 M1]